MIQKPCGVFGVYVSEFRIPSVRHTHLVSLGIWLVGERIYIYFFRIGLKMLKTLVKDVVVYR